MTNVLKMELRPVYIKSCFGLQSRFWDVADGKPRWQVPIIGRGCVWLPLMKPTVSNTGKNNNPFLKIHLQKTLNLKCGLIKAML